MSELDILQKEICKWANKQFGGKRKPITTIKHLMKEVIELSESPYDIGEYADCLMLLIEAAGMIGITGELLIAQAYRELKINKKRKWGKPNKNGFSEHIRG